MKLGVLKDIKCGENRVIFTPKEVLECIDDGHKVYISKDAGEKAGFDNAQYEQSGAVIVDNEWIYNNCDVIIKVKEIEPSEYSMLRAGQIIFTCIHPAAHKEEVDELLKNKVISFAAEDTHRYGSPNGEAAGKAGAFLGLNAMLSTNGGCGKFVSGIGAAPAIHALVLGCGVVGKSAIEFLTSLGARVTVAATNVENLQHISNDYNGKIDTIISNRCNIKKILPQVDMVVNCVRWDKSNTKFLIDREMVKSMPKGSVIVDISNDYGVIETFRETTLDYPTYVEEGVVHYCVSNIPSVIAHSASIAYAAAISKHIRSILNNGVAKACVEDGFLRRGLVTYNGYLTHEETSQIQKRPWIQPEKILGIEDKQLDKAPKTTVAISNYFYDEFK